jgi:hypothetical protein
MGERIHGRMPGRAPPYNARETTAEARASRADRAHWRQSSRERAKDAGLLLDGGQWAGARGLAGHAVECGLKSCVLAFVEKNPDVVFRDRTWSERRGTRPAISTGRR